MKLATIFYLGIILIATSIMSANAQVTIGGSFTPEKGALLDLKEKNTTGENSSKGLGLPRVMLNTKSDLSPSVENATPQDKADHVGLLVYHVGNEELCEGIYVWDGLLWNKVGAACVPPIDPALLYSPNSYFVTPGSVSENIPVAKAYLVWSSRPELGNIDKTDKVSVSLVWQDAQNLISKVELAEGDKGALSAIKVTTASGNKGNALVAVHIGTNGNASDPIRWSWHIWVTDYDPNTTGTIYPHNNGEADYVFMDRNLGATSATGTDFNVMGLMYQWGRKDPFTSESSISGGGLRKLYDISNNELTETNEASEPSGTGIKHIAIGAGVNNNLKNAIVNPTTFYFSDADPYDWYTTDQTGATQDNDLWGNLSKNKSAFDPCPKGWRVPIHSATKSPWAKFASVGWGGSPATFGSYGVTINAISGATQLGFYPYGITRNYNSFNIGYFVGSDPIPYAGGLFNSYAFNGDGHYWTGSQSVDQRTALAEYFNYSGLENSINKKETPRATGAYIRCVKE